jgi:arabinogalactan oligomer/maltooligosaccharide transport system substrate-binding protein
VIQPDVDNTNAVPLFGDRHAAYVITGAWSAPVIQASGVPYAISPLPALPGGGQPVPLLDVDLFYVSASAQSPDLAQEFVRDCATRRDVQVQLGEATGLPPALTAAYRKVAAQDHHYAAWFDAGRDGDPVPALPAMQEVWGPLGQAFADIVAGKEPRQSLTAATRQISSDLP